MGGTDVYDTSVTNAPACELSLKAAFGNRIIK